MCGVWYLFVFSTWKSLTVHKLGLVFVAYNIAKYDSLKSNRKTYVKVMKVQKGTNISPEYSIPTLLFDHSVQCRYPVLCIRYYRSTHGKYQWIRHAEINVHRGQFYNGIRHKIFIVADIPPLRYVIFVTLPSHLTLFDQNFFEFSEATSNLGFDEL